MISSTIQIQVTIVSLKRGKSQEARLVHPASVSLFSSASTGFPIGRTSARSWAGKMPSATWWGWWSMPGCVDPIDCQRRRLGEGRAFRPHLKIGSSNGIQVVNWQIFSWGPMARHFSWDCCWWSHYMAFWWGFTHGRGCWIGPSWILFGPQVWYSAWGIGPEAATTKSRPGKGSRSTSATGGLVLRGIGFTGLRSSDRQQWVGAMKPSFLRFLTSSFNYLFKPTMSTEDQAKWLAFFGGYWWALQLMAHHAHTLL